MPEMDFRRYQESYERKSNRRKSVSFMPELSVFYAWMVLQDACPPVPGLAMLCASIVYSEPWHRSDACYSLGMDASSEKSCSLEADLRVKAFDARG